MSTASAPNAAQPQATETPVLDTVIAATAKRQGIVDGAAAMLGVEPKKLCNLLRNVWHTSQGQPPLTDAEMFIGLSMIARYELDPVAKEVYVTRGKKGLMTIVGIDGWVKILHRTSYFNGFTQEKKYDGGKVVSITTMIYSKTHDYPFPYEALMKEYMRVAGDVANILPVHMLGIFSLRHAARLFVPLSGICMEEEARFAEGRSEPHSTAQSLDQFVGADDPPPDPTPENPPAGDTEETAAAGTEADEQIDPDDADPDERLGDFLAAYDQAKTLEDIDGIDRNAKTDPKVGDKPRQHKIFGIEKGFSTLARQRIGGDA